MCVVYVYMYASELYFPKLSLTLITVKKKTNKKHLVFLYAYPFISQVFCVCNPLQIKFEICGQRKLALEAWCFVYWYLLWYFYNPDSKIVVKNMTEDRIQSFANELY